MEYKNDIFVNEAKHSFYNDVLNIIPDELSTSEERQNYHRDFISYVTLFFSSMKGEIITIDKFNTLLKFICQYDSIPLFFDDTIFFIFTKYQMIYRFFSILSNVSQHLTEIELENINLIFRLFLTISNVQIFSNSIQECGFIQMFLTFFEHFTFDCQKNGIIIADNIVNNGGNDSVTNLFQDRSLFEKIFSYFASLPIEFSKLLASIIKKTNNLNGDIIKSMNTILIHNISNESHQYLIENASQSFLILLKNYKFLLREYIFNSENRQCLKIMYNFGDGLSKGNVIQIYIILIKNSNVKVASTIVRSIMPTTSVFMNDLMKFPDQRKEILQLFIAIAKKSSDLLDLLYDSSLINTIFIIQDELTSECLEITFELLAFIIEKDFKEQTQMVKILLKMLDNDNHNFQAQVLNAIFHLFDNMSRRQQIDKAIEEFKENEGFDILLELAPEHEQAQVILRNFNCTNSID
ncbi:hypothetical protein TRFO_10594 [Tritrichomonas foetus]|uniref:Uncharacterized protein n=1 Tax=Tritrichomonas foetus TaxID=1144522 RepID=A0A1J4JDC0_9EUKA|nr:hypothetical protein TRFO_10594 [Tritrichomonas foetus]|eukprot:OHS95429.1 hypothetical protein TRFO_10594 [Tritrichomonas foetus]